MVRHQFQVFMQSLAYHLKRLLFLGIERAELVHTSHSSIFFTKKAHYKSENNLFYLMHSAKFKFLILLLLFHANSSLA